MNNATSHAAHTPEKTDSTQLISRPLAFVVMPFDKVVPVSGKKRKYPRRSKAELDKLFKLLEKFLRRHEYEVVRSNATGNILEKIIHDIDRASLVICVMTGLNPNVMYELGLAHGLRKKTILLTEDRSELFFDLSGYNCEEYKFGSTEASKALSKIVDDVLQRMREDESGTHGPVETHLAVSEYAVAKSERKAALRRLKQLASELFDMICCNVQVIELLVSLHPEWLVKTDKPYRIDVENCGEIDDEELRGVRSIRQKYQDMHVCIDLLIAEDYLPLDLLSQQEHSTLQWVLMNLRNNIRKDNKFAYKWAMEINVLSIVLVVDLGIIEARLENDSEALKRPLWCLEEFKNGTEESDIYDFSEKFWKNFEAIHSVITNKNLLSSLKTLRDEVAQGN